MFHYHRPVACNYACLPPQGEKLRQIVDDANDTYSNYTAHTRQVTRTYLHREASGQTIASDRQLTRKVRALYGKAGLTLKNLLDSQDACNELTNFRTQSFTLCSSHRIALGGASELLFDALTFRSLKGMPSDHIYSIPTSSAADRLGHIKDDEGNPIGPNRGYDRWLVRRPLIWDNHIILGQESVKTQIKTSRRAARPSRYSPDTLVISAEQIAGGMDNVAPLQRAIIADSKGDHRHKALIDAAFSTLTGVVNTHIANQQPT